MLSKQEIDTRNKCDRYMCRGVALKPDSLKTYNVYGYFYSRNIYSYIFDLKEHNHPVIVNKLSQCTGVKDENEVMSFGNDIVHIEVFSEKLKCLIKWIDGYFFFVDRKGRIRGIEIDFEIIGDRFSNPELLGASK